MKILVIPDIHGSKHWKDNFLKNINNVDKCVFLGDYINSFNENEKGVRSLNNLRDIVDTTKQFEDKVDLLIGNHDLCHCDFNNGYNSHVSGFEHYTARSFSDIFKENKNRFKIAVKYNDWVFSHAGFSKTWSDWVYNTMAMHIPNLNIPKEPVELANWMWENDDCRCLDFNEHCYSPYGDSMISSPLWIRPTSLSQDAFYNKQIVGHTEIRNEKPFSIEIENGKIIVVDSPSHSKCYIFDTESEIIN